MTIVFYFFCKRLVLQMAMQANWSFDITHDSSFFFSNQKRGLNFSQMCFKDRRRNGFFDRKIFKFKFNNPIQIF
ncbi:Uncharacterised protein [Mycobacterium tuberculosis]|nr:Uncharacterised protein [Mycobacterium tuberculosis]